MRPRLNMTGDPQNDTDCDDMDQEEWEELSDAWDAAEEDAAERE